LKREGSGAQGVRIVEVSSKGDDRASGGRLSETRPTREGERNGRYTRNLGTCAQYQRLKVRATGRASVTEVSSATIA